MEIGTSTPTAGCAVAGLAVAFTGPGPMSMDSLLGLTMSGAFWGVAAFIVGLVGGVITLAQRGPTSTAQTVTYEIAVLR